MVLGGIMDDYGITKMLNKIFSREDITKKIDGIRRSDERMKEYLKSIFINPKGMSVLGGFITILLSLALIHSIKSMDAVINDNGVVQDSDKFLSQSKFNFINLTSGGGVDIEDGEIKFKEFTPINFWVAFCNLGKHNKEIVEGQCGPTKTNSDSNSATQQGGSCPNQKMSKDDYKKDYGSGEHSLFDIELWNISRDLMSKIPAKFFMTIGNMFKKAEMTGPTSVFYPLVIVMLFLFYMSFLPILSGLKAVIMPIYILYVFFLKRNFKWSRIPPTEEETKKCEETFALCGLTNFFKSVLIFSFKFPLYSIITTLLATLTMSIVTLSLMLDPWLYLLSNGILSGFSSKNVLGKSIKEELKYNFSNRYFLFGLLVTIFVIPYVMQTQIFFGRNTRNVKKFKLLGGLINSNGMYYSSFIVTFLILYMSYKEIKSKGALILKE